MQKANEYGFGHIDIRALRFLSLLLETRSVTRSGEALGLSQPAASRLLAQLRRALGDDPLIVRASGGGSVLTARAVELVPLLADALSSAERLFSAGGFDPAASERTFRIATTDYGAAVVLAPVARDLRARAPGVSIDIRTFDTSTLNELEEGYLDLALYTDETLPKGFRQNVLFQERFACVVRRDHPVLAHRDEHGTVPVTRLAELPRVLLTYPEGARRGVDDPLLELTGAGQSGSFLTPYFLAGPLLVSQSDHVLCMARRVAELVAEMADVQVVDMPDTMGFTYCIAWHERTDRDPAHIWMRQCIEECVKENGGHNTTMRRP